MVDLSTMVLSETVDSSGGTFRWMAPELLDPKRFGSNDRPTRESDCYALGMVVYEVGLLHYSLLTLVHPSDGQVLTGRRPFYQLHTFEPVPAVLRGERPERPLDAEAPGFSDKLWRLVELCWDVSTSARPTAQRLFDHLSSASLKWALPPVHSANGLDATDSDPSSSLFENRARRRSRWFCRKFGWSH